MKEADLLVIDISQCPREFDKDRLQYHPEVVKLRKACEEWGMFRLVNHGVAHDLLQKILLVSRELLSMPMDVKDTVTSSDPWKSYMRKPGDLITSESFCLVDMPNQDTILDLSRKIWPNEGNSNFCEALGAFSLFLSDLAQRIIRLILVSLGLDAEIFYQYDFEKCKALLRSINGCTSHGKCSGEEALFAHADRCLVTILHNDEEEGLQVRSKEGERINVKPSPNSLIVNLGICFKAWSNGRYMCSVHRVICEVWRNRLSVPYVLNYEDDAQISAPEALVNENNPRRYKPFYFTELQTGLRKEFEKL